MSKKNSNKNKFQAIGVLFLVALTTFGILSFKLFSAKQPATPPDYELTGWLYIGPSAYQLVYRYDSLQESDENGRYILVSKTPQKPSIVLREERHTGGEVSSVVHTQDNSKFIITSHLGDGSQKLLVGVNIANDYETLTPIESQILELGDTYYTAHRVLSFLNDSTILVKTVQHIELGGEKNTYWHAPLSQLTKRTYVSLPY